MNPWKMASVLGITKTVISRPDPVPPLDFCTLDLIVIRFYIAAVLDGYSRKLLALRVFPDAPRTAHVLHLLRNVITNDGAPRHIITDHGCQFKRRFRDAIRDAWDVHLVKGRVASFHTNGKVERFFRTFRMWVRLMPFFGSRKSIQKKLDRYRGWYNVHRPHGALNGRVPEEVWLGTSLPESTPVLETDPIKPAFSVTRVPFRGDPRLPVLEIVVVREGTRAA
ncbi:MAG: integrase core domain-containing protein [Planctomycetota bacterium]